MDNLESSKSTRLETKISDRSSCGRLLSIFILWPGDRNPEIRLDRPSAVFSIQKTARGRRETRESDDHGQPHRRACHYHTSKRCFQQITTMSGGTEDSPTVTNTIREAILHSADLLKTKVTVEGTVRVLDPDLGRMDMAREGSKLIVRLAANIILDGIVVGDEVVVTGMLRKEQRRTFLQATQVQKK